MGAGKWGSRLVCPDFHGPAFSFKISSLSKVHLAKEANKHRQSQIDISKVKSLKDSSLFQERILIKIVTNQRLAVTETKPNMRS